MTTPKRGPVRRWYWCPWHLDRLLWCLTDDDAAARWIQIIENKPDTEIWPRLLAFQRVKRPARIPTACQQADSAWKQAYSAWQQADSAWKQADSAWKQATRDHYDVLDAQRRAEYPDAPPYSLTTGLDMRDPNA